MQFKIRDETYSVNRTYMISLGDNTSQFRVQPWAGYCCGVSSLSNLAVIKAYINLYGYDEFVKTLWEICQKLNPGWNSFTFQLIAGEKEEPWVEKVFKGAVKVHTWENKNIPDTFCFMYFWQPEVK